MSKRYLTVKEFVRFSGLREKTVRRRLKAGQLPAIQAGGYRTRWMIDRVAYARQAILPTALNEQPASSDAAEAREVISGPKPKWKAFHRN